AHRRTAPARMIEGCWRGPLKPDAPDDDARRRALSSAFTAARSLSTPRGALNLLSPPPPPPMPIVVDLPGQVPIQLPGREYPPDRQPQQGLHLLNAGHRPDPPASA